MAVGDVDTALVVCAGAGADVSPKNSGVTTKPLIPMMLLGLHIGRDLVRIYVEEMVFSSSSRQLSGNNGTSALRSSDGYQQGREQGAEP